MQRTHITARLLIGVAVAAVSGCVSVAPQDGPRQPGRSSSPAQDVFPQVVQPPAREALETIGEPSPSPGRPASPAPPSAAPAPDPAKARRVVPPQTTRPPERAAPPSPRRTPRKPVPRIPPAALPALPRLPGGGHDVCALGRGYGGWPAGSREARICEETYGR
ncbi:hypothetical protein [Streptomyces sp. cmx-18-6]|uniref:hypothetical protein n=1 Tax=Streptomyces sp. cmx-18-6 TaxID=2790930 RepID=UPI0039815E9E